MMNVKYGFPVSVAALLLSASGLAFAADESSIMVSGDEPMNVGDAAQMEAPTPDAAEQAKTAEMLKEEAGAIGGDMNPVDEGDAAEIKEPK